MPKMFAYYCDEHELQYLHVCREIVESLATRQHDISVVTASYSWPLHPRHISNVVFRHSLPSVKSAVEICGHEDWIQAEAAWLSSSGMQVVISSLMPHACAAAAEAGIPSVCIADAMWGKKLRCLDRCSSVTK